MAIARSNFRRFVICFTLFVCASNVSSSTLPSGKRVFPLTPFHVQLNSGSADPLVFSDLQDRLELVFLEQLKSFFQLSAGNVTNLHASSTSTTTTTTATTTTTTAAPLVVSMTGQVTYWNSDQGISQTFVDLIQSSALLSKNGNDQLMSRIRNDHVLRVIEDVDIQLDAEAPAANNNTTTGTTTTAAPSNSAPRKRAMKWLVAIISIISVLLAIAVVFITIVIICRVRTRRLRRRQRQAVEHDMGSKNTKESSDGSDTSESPEEEDASWLDDISKAIQEFNADASNWMDDWARAMTSIEMRRPEKVKKHKMIQMATPRPAARQSSRLTLCSIDEESADLEMPEGGTGRQASPRKSFVPPTGIFNPHEMATVDDPNVPTMLIESQQPHEDA